MFAATVRENQSETPIHLLNSAFNRFSLTHKTNGKKRLATKDRKNAQNKRMKKKHTKKHKTKLKDAKKNTQNKK